MYFAREWPLDIDMDFDLELPLVESQLSLLLELLEQPFDPTFDFDPPFEGVGWVVGPGCGEGAEDGYVVGPGCGDGAGDG